MHCTMGDVHATADAAHFLDIFRQVPAQNVLESLVIALRKCMYTLPRHVKHIKLSRD